jgi:hypothetical protein
MGEVRSTGQGISAQGMAVMSASVDDVRTPPVPWLNWSGGPYTARDTWLRMRDPVEQTGGSGEATVDGPMGLSSVLCTLVGPAEPPLEGLSASRSSSCSSPTELRLQLWTCTLEAPRGEAKSSRKCEPHARM